MTPADLRAWLDDQIATACTLTHEERWAAVDRGELEPGSAERADELERETRHGRAEW